jgi:cyclohexanone monooxygenase
MAAASSPVPQRLRALAAHVAAPCGSTAAVRQPEHMQGTNQTTASQEVQGRAQREPRQQEVEVCCIGAGISGLVTAVELSDAGVSSCLLIEKAEDIGGTWHWNKYPGAACDVGSYAYLPYLARLKFVPSKKYVSAPEIIAHLHAVAEQERIYDKTLLSTKVTRAVWDEAATVWRVETDVGDRITAKYLVCGMGPLSTPRLPDIEGQDVFNGASMHTSQWDGDGVESVRGKRVAVVGTGASSAQVCPEIAEVAVRFETLKGQ